MELIVLILIVAFSLLIVGLIGKRWYGKKAKPAAQAADQKKDDEPVMGSTEPVDGMGSRFDKFDDEKPLGGTGMGSYASMFA